MDVLTGYNVPNNKVFNLLFKEVRYQGVIYTLNDSNNNYKKLWKILKTKGIDIIEEMYERWLTDDNEDRYYYKDDGVFVFYDDIDVTDFQTMYYTNNSEIMIVGNVCDETMICLFGSGYREADDQTMLDLITWKKELVDSGRLSKDTNFKNIGK